MVSVASVALALLPGAWNPSAGAQTPAPKASVPPDSNAPWRQSVLAWRAQREKELAAPDGWLTLVGLEWLKPGVNSVGAAADCQIKLGAHAPDHVGKIIVMGKDAHSQTVNLIAPPGGFPAGLTIDGSPAREGPLTIEGPKPSTLAWHGLSMVVLDRGGRFALRIKDADSPTRTGFHGLQWYPPDPHYRVSAEWVPYAEKVFEHIPTVIGTTLDMPSPGFATFTIDGKPFKLQPVIEAGETDKLFFILRDETSQTTTYGAGRFLHTGLPDRGVSRPGHLILDFNELYNPPCAYTPYATCPLPPEQNRLKVGIPAGEEKYMP